VSATWLMVVATLLFAAMGLCAKFASAHYSTGEMVFYRSLIGALLMAVLLRRLKVPRQDRRPADRHRAGGFCRRRADPAADD
jgi:drug/metabolite transporter (DMT)-like permease